MITESAWVKVIAIIERGGGGGRVESGILPNMVPAPVPSSGLAGGLPVQQAPGPLGHAKLTK